MYPKQYQYVLYIVWLCWLGLESDLTTGKDEETNCRTPDREMTVTNEGAAVDLTEAGVIECDSAVLVLEANGKKCAAI